MGHLDDESAENADLRNAEQRTRLVSRVRWLMLGLISLYGLTAGISFFLSPYGFFLSAGQVVVLATSIVAVISYNALYCRCYRRLSRLPFVDQLQIVFDLLFITVLIHFSGGSASWFWPVYMIATIEAAFLLENKGQVLALGVLGGLLYGGVLIAEFTGVVPYVPMPFVDQALHHDALFCFLVWFWVSLLNGAVAFISTYLMSMLRKETDIARGSEKSLASFLDSANDLIFSFLPDGRILYVNPAWKRSLGFTDDDLKELSVIDVLHQDNRLKCMAKMKKLLTGEAVAPMEGRFVGKDGRLVDVEGNMTCSFENGEPVALWSISRDITERKRSQEQLHHLAHHDLLTGLPNRQLFRDHLTRAKSMAKRTGKSVAVLFLDLDRFKIINDTLGHLAGDQLLKETAARLKSCVREMDVVSRFGGDEFTVLLTELGAPADAEKVARKILKKLAKSVELDGQELFITTSIGIALYPRDADEAGALIKQADIAMYQAKSMGRNNFQIFTPDLNMNSERRLELETGLRRALEQEEFLLFYQPKIDVSSGQVVALEALIRWQHPQMGLLMPGEFIPLAEENGLIMDIGEWVLRKACAQNRQWQDAGMPKVRVAVNLSGHQLRKKDLVEKVEGILAETGLEPGCLELEITETVVMQNPAFAASILKELKDLGIWLSIDDFGTGYSSLAHLKRFAVHTLKIDRSFVQEVETNSTDAAIANAIIALGKSLKVDVVAEGVETEGQLSFFREKNCYEMQGFLFGKPMPSEQVPQGVFCAWPPPAEEGGGAAYVAGQQEAIGAAP